MKKSLAVLCVSVTLSGCANLSTVFRDRTMVRAGTQPMSNVVTIDANQRAIISTLGSNPDGTPLAIVCSEPPPDVMSALNSSLGATISAKSSTGSQLEAAAQVASAIATSVATIQRTQTVNLLALSMYRTCERYLNGALSGPEAAAQALRDQRAMVTVLAIEQLTTLGSGRTGSTASVQAGMSDTLASAKSKADASKATFDKANAKVASDIAAASPAAAPTLDGGAGAGVTAGAGSAVGAGGAAGAGAAAGAGGAGAGGAAGAAPAAKAAPAAAAKGKAAAAGKGAGAAPAGVAPPAAASSKCAALTDAAKTACATDQNAADDAKTASDRDEAYYQLQLKLANGATAATNAGGTSAAQPFTEAEVGKIADTVYSLAQLGVQEDLLAIICEFPRTGLKPTAVEQQWFREKTCEDGLALLKESGGQVATSPSGSGGAIPTPAPVKTFGPIGTGSSGGQSTELFIQVHLGSQLAQATALNTGIAAAIPQLLRRPVQVMGPAFDFPAKTDVRYYAEADRPLAVLLSKLIGTAQNSKVGPACFTPDVKGARQGLVEVWLNESPPIDTSKASFGALTAAPDPTCLVPLKK